jgi:hypothetical protein
LVATRHRAVTASQALIVIGFADCWIASKNDRAALSQLLDLSLHSIIVINVPGLRRGHSHSDGQENHRNYWKQLDCF